MLGSLPAAQSWFDDAAVGASLLFTLPVLNGRVSYAGWTWHGAPQYDWMLTLLGLLHA
ncbi:hypothetical protein [Chromobacterium amazonense]|uniref:hypothetical protein n=1 Tax=Chromobacterium amazonense TaxID=1382803 RepID=UPI003F78C3C3